MERDNKTCLLRAEGLSKSFVRGPCFSSAGTTVKAVDEVSFCIEAGSVFSLVGESGCGKSTVARIVLRLLQQDSGSVYFKGRETSSHVRDDMKQFRRSVQMIFQDPFASLNPRMTIGAALSEPYKIHKIKSVSDSKDAAAVLLEKVGLGADAMHRYPHEFSGGQRQRICIARALAVSPELIVADEPLSALDVSIQAQIINLLKGLMAESGFSLMLISHDLNVVRYLSDRVAVMYLGRIVETAGADDLFSSPMHPYTKLLLASAPKISSCAKPGSPEAININANEREEAGCAFYARCSWKMPQCKDVQPTLAAHGNGHVACHLYSK
ncbi:MAG: ATP-binding cassette domain-containing protein [Nitrospiraceae bacterium]|nr:ATP-binding cassette domain-containing protein [Nitrospiraceae bacterium]